MNGTAPAGKPEPEARQILSAALTHPETRGSLRRCALARVGHLVRAPQERLYLAEELLGMTAYEVLRSAHKFTPGSDPLPWIKGFIRRLSLRLSEQEIRERSRSIPIESLRTAESGAAHDPLPDYLCRYDAVEDLVLDALEQTYLLDMVSPLDKSILSAYYLWGDSYNDIAHELDLKPGTVRQRACRAIRRLEAVMARLGEDALSDLLSLQKPTYRLSA